MPSMGTMSLSCIISEISEILVENRLNTTPAFAAPSRRGLHRNIAVRFGTEKLTTRRWKSLKICLLVLIQYITWRTDRRTDGQTPHDGIETWTQWPYRHSYERYQPPQRHGIVVSVQLSCVSDVQPRFFISSLLRRLAAARFFIRKEASSSLLSFSNAAAEADLARAHLFIRASWPATAVLNLLLTLWLKSTFPKLTKSTFQNRVRWTEFWKSALQLLIYLMLMIIKRFGYIY